MADEKISVLSELATLDDADLIPVVDTDLVETKHIKRRGLKIRADSINLAGVIPVFADISSFDVDEAGFAVGTDSSKWSIWRESNAANNITDYGIVEM